MIGVRFESVCKAGMALGVIPNEKSHLSLMSDVRYLVPPRERCDYDFEPESDVAPTLEKLGSHILEYGVPYFARLTSVGLALEAFARHELKEAIGHTWFVPLAHYVLGDSGRAVESARGYLVGMNTRRPNGRQYADFIDRLVNANPYLGADRK
jgi:hypothetical protein